ncbi:SWIM zinc finger family protein [Oscillatoria sp. CS-180]|uniref:SWIM zinc finger family protein n=1 Tax=Oscillatoria sp. CS-180 TaxID=3021720 RepID=UPI00232F5F11|nr:SWIM zinc finger family protein [Oscillatoria sp. CS-180]MDB9526464.1 SWIM zinc finger family protein [Oscillatoria sp. CS-180]
MAKFGRTWWGQKFIEAIEKLTDPGRLSRGRSYASPSRILSFNLEDSTVTAQIRGNVNPYFGVYEEPRYHTVIDFEPISRAKWAAAIALIGSKASLISRLLLNEIPENIEDSFATLGLHLLPAKKGDFHTQCSCPDWSNPCKHVAGLYYRIAEEVDRDPFLLFQLRGLSRDQLQAELAKTPLGQALSAELAAQRKPPTPVDSYFTRPELQSAPELSLKTFWQGEKRLPQTVEAVSPSPVSAVLVKKQGDFPEFWHRDNSFIEAMEGLYGYVKSKNAKKL